MNMQKDSIKILSNNFKPKFCGWRATHKFRCKTKGGNPDIGNYEYIFDVKMKEITQKMDLDDEDSKKIYKLIDEALADVDEDEESTDGDTNS